MKSLTVRLPDSLVAQIETEARERNVSRSEVVRERLIRGAPAKRQRPATVEAIADLIGSIDGLPSDLSARKKHYLRVTGYGRKHRQ
jgi:Arc/MetJ-type ribon-helix-helix transcriptional regulator